MDDDNYEVINCPEDDEYRVFCDICDNLCIERFYENHLKSQSYTNNIYKKQRLNNTKKNKLKLIVFIKLNVCNDCY